MKRIIIAPIITLIIFLIGCKKSSNSPDLTLYYAAKYTHLMGGNRSWERYKTYYVRYNYIDGDTTIKLIDTIDAITIINDTTIKFPSEIYGTAYLQTADSNKLTFSYAGYYHNPITMHTTFVGLWSAYYFPKNDSISLCLHGGGPYSTEFRYNTL